MPIITHETPRPDFEMIPIWAKVFTAYGKQLLVTKSYDDEEEKEQVTFAIETKTGRVSLTLGFPTEETRDLVFNKLRNTEAERLLEGIKDCHDVVSVYEALAGSFS